MFWLIFYTGNNHDSKCCIGWNTSYSCDFVRSEYAENNWVIGWKHQHSKFSLTSFVVSFVLKRIPAIRQGYLNIYLNMFYTGENYDQPSDGYATLFMTNTIYLYTLFNQSFTALIYNYKSLFIWTPWYEATATNINILASIA